MRLFPFCALFGVVIVGHRFNVRLDRRQQFEHRLFSGFGGLQDHSAFSLIGLLEFGRLLRLRFVFCGDWDIPGDDGRRNFVGDVFAFLRLGECRLASLPATAGRAFARLVIVDLLIFPLVFS